VLLLLLLLLLPPLPFKKKVKTQFLFCLQETRVEFVAESVHFLTVSLR